MHRRGLQPTVMLITEYNLGHRLQFLEKSYLTLLRTAMHMCIFLYITWPNYFRHLDVVPAAWPQFQTSGKIVIVTGRDAQFVYVQREQKQKNINWIYQFLQRVSIACYAERCISHDRFCLSDRLSVRPSVTVRYHAKTTPATIMRSSLEDSPMILVSWRLTSPRNSKGNIGREGAEWERGRKNVAKIGNF